MAERVLDVVCKMMLDPDTVPAATTYENEVYYFCGPPCQVAFEEHPERYLATDHERPGESDG
ncbi:MAG: YHS domain-containing protein [Anaerolineae bacterium]|nr:YHS domain-containing protein [Anaerolineae bacterium]